MTQKTNERGQRAKKLDHVHGEGLNWFLILGGALLSTLSIRLGCKLKQAFEAKRTDNANNAINENGKAVAGRSMGACKSNSDSHLCSHDGDNSYWCSSGKLHSAEDIKRPASNQLSKVAADLSLRLVKISTTESNKENGSGLWVSSPDRLELPPKPYHSNLSNSPCVSESGSDIYDKGEVIHKLRQQLKRRDEMMMEMQTQIKNLQNSLSFQVTHSGHLQSQLDSVNQDLFDCDREIQHLRKVVSDQCMSAVSPEKPKITRTWRPKIMNRELNGSFDSVDDVELHYIGTGKPGVEDQVDVLKREVEELKKAIGGMDMLLHSYKEQKVELSSMVNDLQLRLAPQLPNIFCQTTDNRRNRTRFESAFAESSAMGAPDAVESNYGNSLMSSQVEESPFDVPSTSANLQEDFSDFSKAHDVSPEDETTTNALSKINVVAKHGEGELNMPQRSAVGLKNWVCITFAIDPTSLEEAHARLKSFCDRYTTVEREILTQIKSGDVIRSAKLVEGAEEQQQKEEQVKCLRLAPFWFLEDTRLALEVYL